MKMEIQTMLQLVRDVAPLIGGTFKDSPDDMWRGFIVYGTDMQIMFDAWDSKGKVTAWLYREGDRYKGTSKAGEIGCDFARGADAVAREIKRRLIPVAETFANVKRDAWKAENDFAEMVARKAQSLQRKYPDMKISVRDDKRSISIATKYGAGVSLSGYTYYDSRSDKWSFTSDRGAPNLRMDDIDSRDGRAILAIINKNGN